MDQLARGLTGKPVIVCLSKSGLALARKIAPAIGADIHGHACDARCAFPLWANLTLVICSAVAVQLLASVRRAF